MKTVTYDENLWQLVPKEPTPEMVEKCCIEHASGAWPNDYGGTAQKIRRYNAIRSYRAMLAAATKEPTIMGVTIKTVRECNSCDWIGTSDDCCHPKHDSSMLLCPECRETTFEVMQTADALLDACHCNQGQCCHVCDPI